MKKVFLGLMFGMSSFVSFSQVANQLTSVVDLPYGFDFRDSDHKLPNQNGVLVGKSILTQGWDCCTGVPSYDYLMLRSTGNDVESNYTAIRLSNGRGFEIGDVTMQNVKLHLGTTGNLGIGVQYPAYKLHVAGDVKIDGDLHLNNGKKIVFGGSVNLKAADGPYTGGNVYLAAGDGWAEDAEGGSVYIKAGSGDGPNGNVVLEADKSGIIHLKGRTLAMSNNNLSLYGKPYVPGSPIASTYDFATYLMIAEQIFANEITVRQVNWADYVFKDTYVLAPLNEVETFIAANGHLPNVPSEKEVTEKGVNLGEMDAILLRKIEELTLYILEANKRIEELESKAVAK